MATNRPRINQALAWATAQLRSTQPAGRALDAVVLLSSITAKPKAFLYSHDDSLLTIRQWRRYQKMIVARRQGLPVAYSTRRKEFYGLDFYVDKRVLIPRPETEFLVEATVKAAQVKQRPLTIADIGTGSGCIAITLKKQLPDATLYGTDQSSDALAVARRNARHHATKISFRQGNLLIPLAGKKIDIVVANLPYLKPTTLKKNRLLRFEPRAALVSGADGLAAYRRFWTQLQRGVVQPRIILMEIDPSQYRSLPRLIKQAIPTATINLERDLAGAIRYCIVQL